MVNSDSLDQLQQLQTIDQAIKAYEMALAELPRRLEKAQSEEAVVKAQVDEAKAKVNAIQKARKELEQEIEQVGAQILKFQTQKTSVKTNDEFHAINAQIKHQEDRRSELEDQVLSSYDDEEVEDTKLKQIEIKFGEIKKTTEKRHQEMKERSAKDEASLKDLASQREALIPSIDAKTLARYEALKGNKSNGSAVVSTIGVSCGGCHSALPPQVVNSVKKRDKLIACEFCGRFLVYDAAAEGVV
ncbi:MAG: hypothetical protein HKN21_11955 [Candidatus Eisenbacteria bacterium]|uniref:C4-type zinc ribbon domain-containing protein n=1 Tax=Eiseniibacteriota bacterium TaxID=2212470 RepID=A0A7Y2EAI6_UNCEI|nr:hypothetical protein [Candidatus Eisenbacteria bacterium]